MFRTVGRDDQQGPAIAAYIANELKVKKVAIVDDKTAYGEGLANEVEKTLKAAGVQIVARENTTDKATDFKAILTKIKGKNPDVIFYGGMDATGGPMLKQARELGIKADVRVRRRRVHGRDGQARRRRRPKGMVCSQAGIPRRWRRKDFSRRVHRQVRRDQAVRAVLLRRREHPDRGDEEGQLDRPGEVPAGDAKISYDGATGKVEFDDKGDRKDAEMTIFQMKDGKVEPIAIIKAGKTTKLGARRRAAAAPAAAGSAPRRHPAADGAGGPKARTRRRSNAALPQTDESGALGAPFLFRASARRCAARAPCRNRLGLAQCRQHASAGLARRPHDPSRRARGEPLAWTSSCSRSSMA